MDMYITLYYFLCRGALKYHVKLYSGAIDDLNTAISLDPAHATLAFFNRALCYQATGKLQKVGLHVIMHALNGEIPQ